MFMENTIPKPELLIVADEELAYGIDSGYYPCFLQSIKQGNLAILSIEEAQKVNLSKRPIGRNLEERGDF